MNQDMRQCPNCDAYVMSSNAICPRCDHRLDDPPADKTPDESPDARADVPTGTDVPAVQESAHEAAHEAVHEAAHDAASAPAAEDDSLAAQQAAQQAALEAASDTPRDRGTKHDRAIGAGAPEQAADPSRDPAPVGAVEAAVDSIEPADAIAQSEADEDALDMTHPAVRVQPGRYIVPPAPYTPPPAAPAPPITYAPPQYQSPVQPQPSPFSAAATYMQQRVEAYRRGGYRLHSHPPSGAPVPSETVLTFGKRLGVGGWLLALISISGALWYVLLLALSGFQRDAVYVVLESDGYVYEDGPGAAHIRRQRSRVGRRWAVFGLIILFASLLLAVLLGIVAGIVLTQDRYQAALREAYPAVTLFEEQFSTTEADLDDVALAKDGAAAFAILGGIALVGLWGGATLFVIGSIHTTAYQVRVPPLPGWD